MEFGQVTFMTIFGITCLCVATWLFVQRKWEFGWIGMFLFGSICVNAMPFQMGSGFVVAGGLLAFFFLAGAYLLFRKEQWTTSNTIGAVLAVGCGAGWVNLYVWANDICMSC